MLWPRLEQQRYSIYSLLLFLMNRQMSNHFSPYQSSLQKFPAKGVTSLRYLELYSLYNVHTAKYRCVRVYVVKIQDMCLRMKCGKCVYVVKCRKCIKCLSVAICRKCVYVAKCRRRIYAVKCRVGLIRNGVFNFSRNTIIASCRLWLSRLSQFFSLKRESLFRDYRKLFRISDYRENCGSCDKHYFI
jgi:hypothetical protein